MIEFSKIKYIILIIYILTFYKSKIIFKKIKTFLFIQNRGSIFSLYPLC